MIEGAVEEGFLPHRAMVVNTHHEMVQKISEVMKDNDVILLKGSRRMHLEKVAEGLKAKFS
jgi:UDP-N-acetylmuramyl pentapeptide synthase